MNSRQGLLFVFVHVIFLASGCTHNATPPPTTPVQVSTPSEPHEMSKETIERVKAATVLVLNYEGDTLLSTGSGFCLDDPRYVVTNFHVVGGWFNNVNRCKVVFHPGTDDEQRVTVDAERIYTLPDPEKDDESPVPTDLALLELPRKVVEPLKLGASEDLMETQNVWAFGFPHGLDILTINESKLPSPTVHSLRIERMEKSGGEVTLLQIGGSPTSGNSGGPLVNASGEVVGVIVAQQRDTSIVYAIPTARLKALLELKPRRSDGDGTSTEEARRAIQAAYDTMDTAIEREDVDACFTRVTDDYVFITKFGERKSLRQLRQEDKDWFAEAHSFTASTVIEDVTLEGGNVAQVTAKSVWSFVAHNTPTERVRAENVCTDTWIRQNGHWMLKKVLERSRQETKEPLVAERPIQEAGTHVFQDKSAWTAEASSTDNPVYDKSSGTNLYYLPEYAIDGTLTKAWGKGADGDGIEEWLKITFPSSRTVAKVGIVIGYVKHHPDFGDVFWLNNRVKKARLEFSDGSSQVWTFRDVQEMQYMEFDTPITTSFIKLTILDVYAGSKWQDTLISEIDVWGYDD